MPEMVYQVLANVAVIIHLAFILFAVMGGFLVLRWRRLAWFGLNCQSRELLLAVEPTVEPKRLVNSLLPQS
jgi:hypothetical protein